VLEAAALDRYQFVRDAFLQFRRNLVYDGNPPRLTDPEEDDADEATAPKQPAAGQPAADQPKPAATR